MITQKELRSNKKMILGVTFLIKNCNIIKNSIYYEKINQNYWSNSINNYVYKQHTSTSKIFWGGELGFALEDDFGFMYGVSLGGEFGINDKRGITGQVGYILNTFVDNGFFDKYSFNMIPLQLGYKYYFDSNTSGAYLHGQLGVHVLMSSIQYTLTFYDIDPVTFQQTPIEEKISESDSQTNLSASFGGGYIVNENIDLGFRFNGILVDGGNFNYIAIRAAYNF